MFHRNPRMTRGGFTALLASSVLAGGFAPGASAGTLEKSQATSPGASPVASPDAVVPAPPTAEVLPEFQAAAEELRSLGRGAIESLLAGDSASVVEMGTDYFQSVVTAAQLDYSITNIQLNQVKFSYADVGAIWSGTCTPELIGGYFQQAGYLDTFTLAPDDAQTGNVPAGHWSGSLVTLQLPFSVTFTGGADSLAATLDIPTQGLTAQPLDDVSFAASAEIGKRTAEVALPLGPIGVYADVRAWGDDGLRFDIATEDGEAISSLTIRPETVLPPDPRAEYESSVTYRLPWAQGAWFVFWGGPTELQNYHTVTPAQRHAADIVVWRDGGTYSGDGTAAEHYHIWGQKILAPASGTVAAILNDQPDQTPGAPLSQTDPEAFQTLHPAGNHVVLETAEGEYVFHAHMQKGSVQVEVGDKVKVGDVLGLVGNSGNTSEPHLHIHAQDVADLLDPAAIGLPLSFSNYLADGEVVESGIPVQGQFIEPAD